MIFGTVGSSTYFPGFPRLRKWLDDWAEGHDEEVIIQYGADPEPPEFAEGFDFAPMHKIEELTKQARWVVGHAGAGTILTCRMLRAPLIVIPRKPPDEALDDHQEDLANRLDGAGLRVARQPGELNAILRTPPDKVPPLGDSEFIRELRRIATDLMEAK